MQLNNQTPFSAQNALLLNDEGVETCFTIVKASFNIGQQWTLSDEQSPPQPEDEYQGEPCSSSLKYATDYHTGKMSTDIVVCGSACAAELKPVKELDVSVSVGDRQKVLRVFGNRYWRNGAITPPETFKSLPLIYENAFGGQHHIDGQLKSQEMRNPVGKGYQGDKTDIQMDTQPLPNIENPEQLIRVMSDTPEPAGFDFIAPHWHPRAGFCGTYDEQWQLSRAPHPPEDYDRRFQNAAHPSLIYPDFLKGGEAVEITHMHPRGTLRFSLPVARLVGQIKLHRQKTQPLRFNMETLIIKPSAMQLHMVWKAAHICHNDALTIKSIDVGLSR